MRHCYIRLTLGIVFVVCLVFSLLTANIPFALLYLVLAVTYLVSAWSIWKKERGDRP
ncbi:MAG: hypothetical protein Q4F17_08810 [Eubacteriales bacterium]|nr:hypothetical protein [Eubacteriales bacterium]